MNDMKKEKGGLPSIVLYALGALLVFLLGIAVAAYFGKLDQAPVAYEGFD